MAGEAGVPSAIGCDVGAARMTSPKHTLLGGLLRVAAAALSAGAALVSILSYTGMRATIARGAERRRRRPSGRTGCRSLRWPTPPPPSATRSSSPRWSPTTGARRSSASHPYGQRRPRGGRGGPGGHGREPGPGSTTVIVRVGRLEARARVTVDPRPVVSIRRHPDPGGGRRARPRGRHRRGCAGNEIAGAPIRWQAADAAVASVDSLGEVHGVSPGRAPSR
jgi:hypothetical protein